jgi:hypothetical protein
MGLRVFRREGGFVAVDDPHDDGVVARARGSGERAPVEPSAMPLIRLKNIAAQHDSEYGTQ